MLVHHDSRSALCMVTKVPVLLREWYEGLTSSEKRQVEGVLGWLLDLMVFELDASLVEATSNFWDPEQQVLRFGKLEMAPTLAEISGMINLPYLDKEIIDTHRPGVKRVRDVLSLPETCMFPPDQKNLSLDFLYLHYGNPKSFEKYFAHFGEEKDYSIAKNENIGNYSTFSGGRNGFGIKSKNNGEKCRPPAGKGKVDSEFKNKMRGIWKEKRLTAFVMAFLGTIIFPREDERIDFRVVNVAGVLNDPNRKGKVTLVPLILAEFYHALNGVKSGKEFFEGCNLLFQLWMLEHVYPEPVISPGEKWFDNKILMIRNRMDRTRTSYKFPRGSDAWVEYLGNLNESTELVTCLWLKPHEVLWKSTDGYPIVIFGLHKTYGYNPDRLLRQLGHPQDLPYVTDLKKYIHELNDNFRHADLFKKKWRLSEKLGPDSLAPNPYKAGCTEAYLDWTRSDDWKAPTPLLLRRKIVSTETELLTYEVLKLTNELKATQKEVHTQKEQAIGVAGLRETLHHTRSYKNNYQNELRIANSNLERLGKAPLPLLKRHKPNIPVVTSVNHMPKLTKESFEKALKELAAKNTRVDNLKRKIPDLETEEDKEERGDFLSRVNCLQLVNKRLEEENDTLQKALKKIKGVEGCEKSLKSTEKDLETTKKQLADSKEIVKDMEKDLETTKEQLADAKETLKDTEKDLEITKEQLDASNEVLRNTQGALRRTQESLGQFCRGYARLQHAVGSFARRLPQTIWWSRTRESSVTLVAGR